MLPLKNSVVPSNTRLSKGSKPFKTPVAVEREIQNSFESESKGITLFFFHWLLSQNLILTFSSTLEFNTDWFIQEF